MTYCLTENIGVPSPKFQLKKKGAVPIAVAVKVTGVPTVPDDGPVITTTKGQSEVVTT